jgi:hypothetical protein
MDEIFVLEADSPPPVPGSGAIAGENEYGEPPGYWRRMSATDPIRSYFSLRASNLASTFRCARSKDRRRVPP